MHYYVSSLLRFLLCLYLFIIFVLLSFAHSHSNRHVLYHSNAWRAVCNVNKNLLQGICSFRRKPENTERKKKVFSRYSDEAEYMPVVTEKESKAVLRAPMKCEQSQLGFLQEVVFVRRSWPAGYSLCAVSQRSPSPAQGVPLKTEVRRENEVLWVNSFFALSKTFQVSNKHCVDMFPPSFVSNCANASTTPLQDFMVLWNFVYNEETYVVESTDC